MIGNIRWPELLLFLVIILLVFGVGRISKVAGELGSGIRAFKKGISGEEKEKQESESDSTKESDD
ncbi:MAG: twin-arginine translocase TatA/TatE family subunit [Anaerolineaceae bacterium]|nr:twin-arginine translocase TatA/TatE family subunit [Anaerolineaceae bacterium]